VDETDLVLVTVFVDLYERSTVFRHATTAAKAGENVGVVGEELSKFVSVPGFDRFGLIGVG
jgi:hypothetical protein